MAEKRSHTGRVVRKEIQLEASAREVWDAWADPDLIAKWFVDKAEGKAEPGQVMTWIFESFGYRIPVPILEAEPGKSLVIGGEMPGRPPFLQEIDLEQDGGKTVIRLANSGFGEGEDWDDEYEGVDSGWVMALTTLKHWLENFREQPRTHVICMRPVPFEYAQVQPLFTSVEGLSSWLGDDIALSPTPLTEGGILTVTLPGNEKLEGKVIARTHREVLVDWPRKNAVLGLKCFKGPDGRTVALDFNAWGLLETDATWARKTMEELVDRLAAAIPRSSEATNS